MKNKNYKYSQSSNGFTVIELLTVIGILLVVMTAVYAVSITGFKNQFFMQELNDAAEEAKRGIEVMVAEIREAANGDDGSYPIVSAQNFELIFFSNIDEDGLTERVRYFLDNSQLKRGITKPAGFPLAYNPEANEAVETLVSYVSNDFGSEPIFFYYNQNYPGDEANNPLTTPANLLAVRAIKIRLFTNVNLERAPDDIELSSFVQIRNLKTNL